jgi:hypothetical protein
MALKAKLLAGVNGPRKILLFDELIISSNAAMQAVLVDIHLGQSVAVTGQAAILDPDDVVVASGRVESGRVSSGYITPQWIPQNLPLRLSGVADGSLPALSGFGRGRIQRRAAGTGSGQLAPARGSGSGHFVLLGQAEGAAPGLIGYGQGWRVSVGGASGVLPGLRGRAVGVVSEGIPDEVAALALLAIKRWAKGRACKTD